MTYGDGPVRISHCLYAESTDPPIHSCFAQAGHGHGTHVAGIAAARNNEEGIIGIAHFEGSSATNNASFRVCGVPQDPEEDRCPSAGIIAAIDWTATNGWPRQVVNMSIGTPFQIGQTWASVVASSYNAGNVLVAAAGNHSGTNLQVFWPARFPEVIAVSGTRSDDSFAHATWCAATHSPSMRGSVHGPEVELSAPFSSKSLWTQGGYAVDCGTSMAAPVVSAAAALVWTKNPSWTNQQVRAHLAATAKDLGAPGWDEYFGFGRIDVGAAVGVPPPSVQISGPTLITSSDTYTWTASASGGLGGYSYQWYRRTHVDWPTCLYQTAWEPVGDGTSSYSAVVRPWHYDFQLLVDVQSGPETGSGQIKVYVGDGSQICPS
jgi:subtilisin